MKYWYIADAIKRDDGKTTLLLKYEISKEVFQKLNNDFSICGITHAITEIKDIVIENGETFKNWMKPENLQNQREHGIEAERMILLSNKLVLNYASSIKTYIDIETRLLAKHKKEKAEYFEKLQSAFYDKHMEYRFWANFRNYVVHCALPYTGFEETIGKPCNIICLKSHLLEYKKWKQSQDDIREMPDSINLVALVDNMSSLIYTMYLDFYNLFSEEIIKGIKSYSTICVEYEVQNPIICTTPEPWDIAKGKILPLPIPQLQKAFNVLKSNPNVTITVKN